MKFKWGEYRRLNDRLVNEFIKPQVDDERVLKAFYEVPRHVFVPHDWVELAYEDRALPIGFEQTISQPSLVAMMTQLLEPGSRDRVLEVGTGFSYQAAILSKLTAKVFSVERIVELADEARSKLRSLGYTNVQIKQGDGSLGWVEEAPFDAIIVTAAGDFVPGKLKEQLKEGGRIVMPVSTRDSGQDLLVGVKRRGKVKTRKVARVQFVPLVVG